MGSVRHLINFQQPPPLDIRYDCTGPCAGRLLLTAQTLNTESHLVTFSCDSFKNGRNVVVCEIAESWLMRYISIGGDIRGMTQAIHWNFGVC